MFKSASKSLRTASPLHEYFQFCLIRLILQQIPHIRYFVRQPGPLVPTLQQVTGSGEPVNLKLTTSKKELTVTASYDFCN